MWGAILARVSTNRFAFCFGLRASRPQLNRDRGRLARNEREAREGVIPFAPCNGRNGRSHVDFRLALSGNGAAGDRI